MGDGSYLYPYCGFIYIHATGARLGEVSLFRVFTVKSIIQTCGICRLFLSTASYDYGAAIGESRGITTKFTELKAQGLFLRSSPEFLKTDRVGNSTSGVVQVTNPNAFVTFLTNPDTGAGFWIARQTDSSSTYGRYTPPCELTS